MRKAARAELKLDTQYECYRKLIRKLYMLLNHVSKQVYLCTILNFKQAGIFILAFGCVFNHNILSFKVDCILKIYTFFVLFKQPKKQNLQQNEQKVKVSESLSSE